ASTRLKESEVAEEAAWKRLDEAEKKLSRILEATRAGLSDSAKDFTDRKLMQMLHSPELFNTHHKAFLSAIEGSTPARRDAVESTRLRLLKAGLATNLTEGRLAWKPIRRGDADLDQRLTNYERQLIAGFNAALLSQLLFPGALSVSSSPNFVDVRLCT